MEILLSQILHILALSYNLQSSFNSIQNSESVLRITKIGAPLSSLASLQELWTNIEIRYYILEICFGLLFTYFWISYKFWSIFFFCLRLKCTKNLHWWAFCKKVFYMAIFFMEAFKVPLIIRSFEMAKLYLYPVQLC